MRIQIDHATSRRPHGHEMNEGRTTMRTSSSSSARGSTSNTNGDDDNDDRVRMDRSIQATSDDAIRAKEAAVRAGYYKDPFVSFFYNNSDRSDPPYPHQQQQQQQRRPPVQPIIKRGTHARVACMDRALVAFLNLHAARNIASDDGEPVVQVVVLGAGKDTTFFRLQAGLLLEPQTQQQQDGVVSVRWFEVDHPALVVEKAAILERFSQRFGGITRQKEQTNSNTDCIRFRGGDVDADSTAGEHPCWREKGSSYHLVAHDLRSDPQLLLAKLKSSSNDGNCFDSRLPTLFMIECVLMYLPEVSSKSLLEAICQEHFCARPFLVLYEPILGMSSPFGQVMEKNLTAAGVVVSGGSNNDGHNNTNASCLVQTRTLQQHLTKLNNAGFALATGCDMGVAYETVMRPEQRRKANACEFLDEVEEWMLIMKHYCLVVAATSTDGSSDGERFCEVGKSSPMGFVQGRCETQTWTST